MKKIFSIVVLLFFCWQFVGSYLYFESARHDIREKAKKMMKSSSSNFQILQLTQKEFKKVIWIKEHEIQYQSNLYDVKSISKNGKQIDIVCILDKDENRLISYYSNQIQTNQSDKEGNATGNLVWHKVLNTVYLSPTFDSDFFILDSELNSNLKIPYIENQSSPHLRSIFTPPIYS